MKTALVFLAGQPDAAKTPVSSDKTAANADKKETITVTLTPRDSHNNVVPLWTFRKDLTIVPSVNATVPGAVTVTTPAQDPAGAVTATLTYVDTSGKLLSKEARAGTTTITIGKAVKQTVDTRFYPQVNICLTNLDSDGFVTPGTTEVHICDGSGHTIPSGSGYTVTAPGISSSGCPTDGGGVCPSDAAGVKADFTNLTGDDIRALARIISFHINDVYAGHTSETSFNEGNIAFFGELKSHKGARDLSESDDLFHTIESKSYCRDVVQRFPDNSDDASHAGKAAQAVMKGSPTGGTTSNDTVMATIHMGNIGSAIRTGGDTNPEMFVAGSRSVDYHDPSGYLSTYREAKYDTATRTYQFGAIIPGAIVFVNGGRKAAIKWDYVNDGPDNISHLGESWPYEFSIGWRMHHVTAWNLSDAYYVNNWPGTPYTQHKAGDIN
ncbi:hypothetical protein ACFVQQ_004964, partial [Salmonella enterica]